MDFGAKITEEGFGIASRPDPCQLTWFDEALLLISAPGGIKSAVIAIFSALAMSANAVGLDLNEP